MSWRNRIVGYEDMAVSALRDAAHPGNWRIHPKYQAAGLKSILDDIGVVQSVIMNRRSEAMGWPPDSRPVLVDGHLRVELAVKEGIAALPVVVVDLAPDEEGVVLATLDPLGEMAKHDTGKLGDIMMRVAGNRPALAELFERIAGNVPDSNISYTAKVQSPVYEPTGENPPVSQLVDRARRDELARSIEAAGLEDDVRSFLLAAAERHLVFDYRQIAEYYAHATPQVQRLMEASALVIIDFAQAIELGYVKLAEELRSQYLKDWTDDR